VQSGALGCFAHLLELLSNALGNGAKALGTSAIYLARNTMQLLCNATLLLGVSLAIGDNPRGFCRLTLLLGAPALGLVIVAVGFVSHIQDRKRRAA